MSPVSLSGLALALRTYCTHVWYLHTFCPPRMLKQTGQPAHFFPNSQHPRDVMEHGKATGILLGH